VEAVGAGARDHGYLAAAIAASLDGVVAGQNADFVEHVGVHAEGGCVAAGFVSQGDQWTKSTFLFDTRYPEYEIYAQDTWKVQPNLTVDLGLRYEIRLSPDTPGSNVLVPNQAMVAGGAPSNTVQWVPGKLFKNQLGNFGPSVGFAWDPFRTGKTSIRANYRIAYDRINDFVVASTILPNLPGAAFAAINTDFGQGGGRLSNLPALNPPTARPSSLTQPAAFSSASNTVVDPNLKTPRTHQWALNIQREVARNTIVDIAYIGRRGTHLLGAYNVNQDQIFNNGFLDAFNTVKAGGESTLINNLLKADTRLNAGESGSQMLRRLSASTLALNSVGALASSIATRLQGGVSVTQLSAGQPFVFIPYPQFSSLNVLERAKFSASGAGQFGNTGRNFFLAPHYFELDASLLKRVPVTERVKLEFRGDATNLTNTPSFAAPTTDITSSLFGRIRNSLSSGSRKIQVGAKIHF